MKVKLQLIESISTMIGSNQCIMEKVIRNHKLLNKQDFAKLYALSEAKFKFIEEKSNYTTFEEQTHFTNNKLLKCFYES
jgi:uncharacterized protein YjcR